jgi:peptidoglycan hydrolase-like protein with peptidoglycan-binding domain
LSRCRTLCAGLLLAVFALPVAQADARRITFGERDLRQGMRGSDVRVLQDFLTKAGVKTSVDGQFGPGTKRRVRSWERKSKLPIDGVVTREDAATLRGQVGQDASGLQNTGGAQPVAAPTGNATLGSDGLAVAPAGAPPEVAAVIAAANEIVGKPYKYGGGHGDWNDSGYDCSGSESYALHGAGLVSRPLNSTEFMSWGEAGEGQWITSYANSGHSYLVVAGLRFDTGYNGGGSGPKWSTEMRPADAYTARHPEGL